VKKVAFGLCVVLVVSFFNVGMMVGDTPYFSIYYSLDGEIKTVVISDKSLTPKWWDIQSKREFTKNKSLQQRANEIKIDKVLDAEMTMQRRFPEIYKIVQQIKNEVLKQKNDGTIHFDPDKETKFWITDQENGRELDIDRLCRDIFNSLQKGTFTQIKANISDTKPDTPDKILGRIVERSRFATIFADNAPRESNIALALESFDGLIVSDGEIVSFNDVVGRRTRDRGFKEAKIIVDGEFVDGVGGGVCQVSTTIFNAVLLSGLKIVESHNHSLAISYVPLGLDAMVSSAADLRFQNNSGSPIYIEAKFIDNGARNSALVKIYGGKSDIRYIPRVERRTLDQQVEIVGEIPQEISGTDFASGQNWFYQERILQNGYPPRETTTYLDGYKGDEIISSKRIRKSRYKGKERIVTYERVVQQANVQGSWI